MKKILITGSNGLVGQKLIELLLAQPDLELIASSRGENKHLGKQGYTYVELDICDKVHVKKVLKKYHPHAIVHAAAMTNVDTCEINQEQCRAQNVNALIHLIEYTKEIDSHLIHLSTDFIFDGESSPYKESDKPNPLSFYGQTKLEAEELLKASSCHWTILRTILVYGVVKNLSRTNIVLWIKKTLEKSEPIYVVDDQWRMPTLAEDLATACLLAIKQKARGIYHISGKDMMSILELARQVADFWHLDQSLIHTVSSATLAQMATRPKRTGFVLDKSMNELGYRPHSFKEGLAILNNQL